MSRWFLLPLPPLRMQPAFTALTSNFFHAKLAHLGINMIAFSGFGMLMTRVAHSLSSVQPASLQTCLEFLRCTACNHCPCPSTCVGSKGRGSKVSYLCHVGAWARAIFGVLCISGNGFLLDQLHWPPAQLHGRPLCGRVWSCVCLLCCCGNIAPWYFCYYLHCGLARSGPNRLQHSLVCT